MAKWSKDKILAMGLTINGSTGDVSMVSRGVQVVDDEHQGLDLLNRRIFIPGEVRSSKNSRKLKIVTKRDKTTGSTKKVPISENSDAAKKYKADTCWYYKLFATNFLSMAKGKPFPLLVEFQFVREDHQKFDFANMVQLPQDMMRDFGWIPDDDIHHLLPIPNAEAPYIINPLRPGVWIKIL